MPTCLVTGAAGIVATALRPMLAARCERLLLTDLRPVTDLAANETFEPADLADAAALQRLAARCDAIVHLGGLVGAQYSLDEVLGPNVAGTHRLFEAARLAGIRRVVFASSHHAVGFLPRGRLIDESAAPRPDSPYGLSKAYGEAAAAYFADRYGLDILVIRIGFVGEKVIDERRLHIWISPRDLFQLIEIGLFGNFSGCRIIYGVSNTPEPFFDNRNASALGYRPRDNAVDHLADASLLSASPDASTPAGRFVGGSFCES